MQIHILLVIFFQFIECCVMSRNSGKLASIFSPTMRQYESDRDDVFSAPVLQSYDDSELTLPRYDERAVWIRCYGSSGTGIGGILTHWWRPSDFEVIELRGEDGKKVTSTKNPDPIDHVEQNSTLENSCFLKFLLQKQGWDTLSALNAISKRLDEMGAHLDVTQFG
jgi:hypothetical protein